MATQNEVIYNRSQGAVWIQPDGPGTKYYYLNCAGLAGFDRSDGDITLLYCKDEGRSGKFKVRGSVQGDPSPVTTSMTIPLGKTSNYVFGLKCKFNLQTRYTDCDRPDDHLLWQKIVHFRGARVTQRSSDALVARNGGEDGEVMTTISLSAEDVYEINKVDVNRTTDITESAALNDVAFDTTERCDGSCGPAQAACDTGFAVADAHTYPATANVHITTDGGGSWDATATDPFGVSENISSVAYVGDRVIVARGTTDASNPAEIAYSDDSGTTWTTVNVGSVNGQYILRLFWLANPYLWAITDDGYVYFSDDAGLSWTAQEEGVSTTQQLNDIDFASPKVGFIVGNSNAMLKTEDGGEAWTAVTGPAGGTNLNTVEVIDADTIFVGTAGGELYKSDDGGDTWTELAFADSGTGQVRDVEFFDDSVGYMLWNSSGPVGKVYRTIDGGKTFVAHTTPTNAGLNRLAVCDQNTAFAVGEVQSTKPVILLIA